MEDQALAQKIDSQLAIVYATCSKSLKKSYKAERNMYNVLGPLTKENAKDTTLVVCLSDPQWGIKSFIYKPGDNCETGQGCNGSMLFEHSYKFFARVAFKR